MAKRKVLISKDEEDKIVEIKKVEESFFAVKFNNDVEGRLVKDAVARKYEDEA